MWKRWRDQSDIPFAHSSRSFQEFYTFSRKANGDLPQNQTAICKKTQCSFKHKQSLLSWGLILCSLNLTCHPLMSMKTPPQWNISSRVIILIFITQEFLFLSDGVWVSGAQLMVSPAPLADIAVDDLTECAFPLHTFQNGTTSLPISCSLEGGPIWFTLQLKSSGQTYYNFLGSKAWHRREKCPHNKQMDSKQMLEGRSKFQESSWMKEVWNNNWYNSMLLHIGRNWDVFCLPKISNQHAS